MDEYHLFEDGTIMLYEDGTPMLLDSSGFGNWVPQPPQTGEWDEQAPSSGNWVIQ